MKIKKYSEFLNENKTPENFIPDFLYHSIEPENYDSIMRYGLRGDIYLTFTPKEAEKHHPIILKIDVRNRQLINSNEGWIVKDVPIDNIELYNK